VTLADAPTRAPVDGRDGDDGGDRGGLEVHRSVVRKVAAHAVARVPDALPGASVKVHGDGPDVEIAVKVALRYPAPVREAAREVRRSVADEVERITGHRVLDVTVVVTALRTATRPRVE